MYHKFMIACNMCKEAELTKSDLAPRAYRLLLGTTDDV
jgi:hypothetical protein